MVYSLRRFTQQSGVGPVRLFRALPNAIGQTQWQVKQVPQGYIQTLPGFGLLAAALAGGSTTLNNQAAALAATTNPEKIAKAWTEVLYEEVRAQVAPTAPSRLNSLWAFLDPLEAFALSDRTATAYVVFEAEVLPGITWFVADMSAFSVPQFSGFAASDFLSAEAAVRADASRYWRDGLTSNEPEVLVGGGLTLVSNALRLLDWLRGAGLLS